MALPTHRFDRSRAFIEEWAEIMAGRRRLLQHLIGNEPWDLFMVVFSITDNMAHVFWTYVDPAHPNYYRPEGKPFREAFFKAYEQCDALLGDLMAIAGEDTFTLVLSDHGFGSVRPRQYVYKRLLEGGYIAPRQSGSANPFTEKLVKLAVNTYSRFPQLREWAKNLRPGRRELLKKSLRRAGAMPDATEIDYPKSKVILSDFGLQVWVNDDERFAHGIVSAGEREKILEELGAFLKADRDPITGEAIVKACHRGIDVYHGPFARRCPDLIVEYNNFFDRTASSDKRNPHVEGGHTAEGILIAAGQGIRPVSLEGSRLVDLAPTILHLLGQEVPPDMDGRVLLEAFTERYRNLHPVQEGTAPARLEEVSAGEDLTEEQDAELREQLRQLGYL